MISGSSAATEFGIKLHLFFPMWCERKVLSDRDYLERWGRDHMVILPIIYIMI